MHRMRRGLCRCSPYEQQSALPGCPETSIARRRWLHHNSCGGTIDPEDPEYYWNSRDGEEDADVVDYNGAAAPASDYAYAAPSPLPEGDPFLHPYCFDPSYYETDPGLDYPEGVGV